MSKASRARSESLSKGLADVPLSTEPASSTLKAQLSSPSPHPTSSKLNDPAPIISDNHKRGFVSDLITFRWAVNPSTSFKMIVAVLALWTGLQFTVGEEANWLSHAIFISHPLPIEATESRVHYEKGVHDLSFLAFYIVVFSFIRQGVTEYVLRPLAKWSGLKKRAKQTRFMEQAYAVLYNLCTASLGLYVMKNNGSWFYKTDAFWIDYPHWRMKPEVKYYYLLQAAYWLQQMIVLGLRLEKPRSDYYQLIIHHLVTLWLIGWSYAINLTVIGVAVFISMDVPEIFLAGSKCLNYVGLQHTSEVSFVALLLVWTYMRHYLNCKILYSVWTEFDLIPHHFRSWVHEPGYPHDIRGWWVFSAWGTGRLPYWMKYQIALPIALLQMVNAFWSYLLWRIAYRLVAGVVISDIREEGETDDEKDD
ncbi:longevity assurance proteins LAG1/LAC1 [Meredithblackwellia eburnea MCA 4105]